MTYDEPGECDAGCGRPREKRADSDRRWKRLCGAEECEAWLNAKHQRDYRDRRVHEQVADQQGYDLDLPLAHLRPEEQTVLDGQIRTAMDAANGASKSLTTLRAALTGIFEEDAKQMLLRGGGRMRAVRGEEDVDDLLNRRERDTPGLEPSIDRLWDALIEATELLEQAHRRHDLWRERNKGAD